MSARRIDTSLMKPLGLCLAVLLLSMIGLAGCGSEDTTSSAQSCEFHSDCPLGTSCSFENKCIVADCSNCQNDTSLICLHTEDHPEGVCSMPECVSDDDCDTAAGETCNDGECGTGGGNNGGNCSSDDDCGADETCSLAGQCVPDEGGNTCSTSADCGAGEYCDSATGECASGDCGVDADCDTAAGETCNTQTHTCEGGSSDPCGGCPSGQTCNTQTNQCESGSTDPCGGACPSGQHCDTASDTCVADQACDPACGTDQVCNPTTGTCEDNNCPTGSPTPQDCANDPVYNKFDPDGCYCAECLSDNDCDTAAGESCNPNGECMNCSEQCDPSQGGNACSQAGFYCVSNCCVECVGNTDCPQGDVCVDGACGPPPDCSTDPTVCTGGMVCNQSTGQCETPQTGQSCSVPTDCPQGQFCQGGQCQDLTGGGIGGGTCDPATTMCNSDCTCPGNSTCQFGMMCTGCQGTILSSDCPAGQACLAGVCWDLGM